MYAWSKQNRAPWSDFRDARRSNSSAGKAQTNANANAVLSDGYLTNCEHLHNHGTETIHRVQSGLMLEDPGYSTTSGHPSAKALGYFQELQHMKH